MRGKKWTKEVEAMEAVNEDEPAVFDSDLKAVGGLVHPAERNGVRTLSWAEGGVSPSILRGPDGLVGLPKPPGASWDVFSSHESGMPEGHPEGGDISKCPFAALVMDTYSANPAAAVRPWSSPCWARSPCRSGLPRGRPSRRSASPERLPPQGPRPAMSRPSICAASLFPQTLHPSPCFPSSPLVWQCPSLLPPHRTDVLPEL